MAAVLMATHALEHQGQKAKAKPIKRPEMTSAGTTEGWTYFLTRWRTYKRAVALTDQDTVAQLLECCDEKLRRDMTRNTIGPTPLEDMAEDAILATMRSLAVKEENPKVARIALSRMFQDRGEPIRAYAARLRGQAEVCRFVKCRLRSDLQPGGGACGRPSVYRTR